MDSELERMGRILLSEGIVLHEELEAAIEAGGLERTSLGEALRRLSLIRQEELASFLGADYRIPTVPNLDAFPREDMDKLLPQNIAQQYSVAPLCRAGNLVVVAFGEEPTEVVVRNLQQLVGGKIKIVRSPKTQVDAVIRRCYGLPEVGVHPSTETRVQLRAVGTDTNGSAVEAIAIPRDEYEKLARDYGEPAVRRWEKLVSGEEPIAAQKVK